MLPLEGHMIVEYIMTAKCVHDTFRAYLYINLNKSTMKNSAGAKKTLK
jgi:hypothetical protein